MLNEYTARWLVFSGILALVIARAPVLLLEPRFWAEEGIIHFAYARSHHWFQALCFVPLSGGPAGYFNLVPNLAALISSRCVALETAPLVSTLVALAVQLVPFAIVVWGRSTLWSTLPQRCIGCLLLVLAPCVVGDVWVNTINSQVFLGLATLLILCERLEGSSRGRQNTYRGLIVLAGLTGVYTAALAPAAILRAHWARVREARVHAALVVGSAIFQAAIYLLTKAAFGLERHRFDVADWSRTIAFAAYHCIIRPVVGDDVGVQLTAAIGLQEALGGPNLWRPLRYFPDLPDAYATWAVVLSLSVVAGLLGILGWPRHLGQKILLAAMFSLWLVILLATAPALPRLRYAVLPGLVVVLAMFQCALRSRRPSRWLARLLVVVCLLAGLKDFRHAIPPSAFGQLPNRPDWKQQVARWRSQPDSPLLTWPYNSAGGWRLYLRPSSHEPIATVDLIEEGAAKLVTKGPAVEHVFSIQRMPDDFKIVLVLDSTQADSEVDLNIRLLDERGVTVVSTQVHGFDAGPRRRLVLWHGEMIPGRRLSLTSVRQLVVSLRSALRSPVRVRIYQLTISHELDSLLERTWSKLSDP